MLRLLFISLITFLTITADQKDFIIVAQDGSGDFRNITDAVESLPAFNYERIVIYIKAGLYEERIKLTQDHITLIGENRETTIIQFNMPREYWIANKDHIGPGIINIESDDIIIENLTIINTQPEIGPHAFAIYGTGTRTIITNCTVLSKGADTIALWDYKTGMYYISDCYIEGAVDFVCPRSWCYLKNSELYEVKATAAMWHAGGYDKNQKFVIVNSSFDGVKGFKLGRHHYEAQFYFINCSFSGNMVDEPIYRVTYEDTTKNRPFNWGERYYFYNSSGEGSNYNWLKDNLESAEGSPSADEITPQWTFNNNWNPEDYIPTIIHASIK